MIHILEFFLLFIPLIWEAITDWYRIEVRHKTDNHTEDVWVRIGICVLVGISLRFLMPDKNAIQGFLFSGSIFICFFDPILNLLRGKKLFEKGTTAKTDRLLSHLPLPAEIFVRLWVLLVGYAFYYDWSLIFPNS